MVWIVDTCVLLDVFSADPKFGDLSAQLLEKCASAGLAICPITYAELAPAFKGNAILQNEFLTEIGIDFRLAWSWRETEMAQHGWNRFIQLRKTLTVPKRPIADIFIGAFAAVHGGLLTRNEDDFERIFPGLKIRSGMKKAAAG